jgi:hypothetical protein
MVVDKKLGVDPIISGSVEFIDKLEQESGIILKEKQPGRQKK